MRTVKRTFLDRPVDITEIEYDGMHQGMRRRRIGVLDDERQRRSVLGRPVPFERRRKSLAVGREAFRNAGVEDEGPAADVEASRLALPEQLVVQYLLHSRPL